MALEITVKGIVQGVGFRPFIYRLAQEYQLSGWVLNNVEGVRIHAEGPAAKVNEFVEQIAIQAPEAACISSLKSSEVPNDNKRGFSIVASESTLVKDTAFVSPDLATCPACLEELLSEDDARSGYPFINCTNCGPRFTIIEQLPYDRGHTSMASFALCPSCAEEYSSVANRRFHAQPNACFECGPHIEFFVPATQEQMQGQTKEQSNAIIARAAQLLAEGKILALKGLGGYYLACDATNEEAVLTLRQRKQRPRKPLAVMYKNLEAIKRRFAVNSGEEALLTSAAAPIVLLQGSTQSEQDNAVQVPGHTLAYAVTCGVSETGVMLPSTPLHHLLLRAAQGPLVMTSGNMSEEPIIGNDELALKHLSSIADAFIINNRPIVSRYDDSVVRVIARPGSNQQGTLAQTSTKESCHPLILTSQVVRRARGYAPRPLTLPSELAGNQTVLAVGPEQKNTFCLTRNAQAFVSQHLGDLENANSFDNQLQTIALYEKLFSLEPAILACDNHPEYLSSKWAREQSRTTKLPLVQVQHHHAHIAAVMAEAFSAGDFEPEEGKALAQQEVLGLALDGTGYGADGTIWGGEVLVASLTSARQIAHLECFALPGGAQAVRNPLRCAYALLLHHKLTHHPAAAGVLERLGKEQATLIEQMLSKNLNSPQTSSAGRLFDAISAVLGISHEASYEGEPAIMLEAALRGERAVAVREEARETDCMHTTHQGSLEESISTYHLVKNVLDNLSAGLPLASIVKSFHDEFMDLLLETLKAARSSTGLKTVALSGGVFNNRYLATHLPRLLKQEGFAVLEHKELPPNDGCIAYGEAVVALAHVKQDAENTRGNNKRGGATL